MDGGCVGLFQEAFGEFFWTLMVEFDPEIQQLQNAQVLTPPPPQMPHPKPIYLAIYGV